MATTGTILGAGLYSRFYISVGNSASTLTENTSLNINFITNTTQVMSVSNGFGGITMGSQYCEITASGNIPSSGMEFDPSEHAISGLMETFYLTNNDGITFAAQGFIIDPSISYENNGNAKLDFKIWTAAAPFSGL